MFASVLQQTLSPSNCPHSSAQVPPYTTTMSEEQDDTFKDLVIVKVLNKAKFPVYLVNSQVKKRDYAMKIFPYSSEQPHLYFYNESRFSFLDHPNVIKTHHVEKERETVYQNISKKVSYTVMDYAPYGDFFDMLAKHGASINDKLIRTYFRQLIQGLEYLHNNGVAHMDLKLENILVGADFKLRIADFDLSYMFGDSKLISRGTRFYRAPELISGRCQDPMASDIYSAGIILFTLKSRGVLPHAEDGLVAGVDFAGLLYTQNDEFYRKHCEVQKQDASYFDDEFKELFHSMVVLKAQNRATIAQIKKSKWYNGPCYTDEELKEYVASMYGIH